MENLSLTVTWTNCAKSLCLNILFFNMNAISCAVLGGPLNSQK